MEQCMIAEDLEDIDYSNIFQEFNSNVNDNNSEKKPAELVENSTAVLNKESNNDESIIPAYKNRVTFPIKLHRMLSECDKEEYSSIISWCQHGRAFLVHSVEKFMKVLPKYFNHSKYTSFQRQLNSYGFHRFSGGMDHGAYYHHLFIRGRGNLCTKISRVKRNKIGPQVDIELYSLPFVGPDGQELCKPSPVQYNTAFNHSQHENKTYQPQNHSGILKIRKVKPCLSENDSCAEKVCSARILDTGVNTDQLNIRPLAPDNPYDQVEFFVPLDFLLKK